MVLLKMFGKNNTTAVLSRNLKPQPKINYSVNKYCRKLSVVKIGLIQSVCTSNRRGGVEWIQFSMTYHRTTILKPQFGGANKIFFNYAISKIKADNNSDKSSFKNIVFKKEKYETNLF